MMSDATLSYIILSFSILLLLCEWMDQYFKSHTVLNWSHAYYVNLQIGLSNGTRGSWILYASWYKVAYLNKTWHFITTKLRSVFFIWKNPHTVHATKCFLVTTHTHLFYKIYVFIHIWGLIVCINILFKCIRHIAPVRCRKYSIFFPFFLFFFRDALIWSDTQLVCRHSSCYAK